MDIYGVIGNNNMDNLMEDPRGAEKIAINVLPGIGAVGKGTLMYRMSTGYYTVAPDANVTTGYDLVVLAEDIDAGTAPNAVAEDAAAYRAGRFVSGKVLLASGNALTAANLLALRQEGIVIKPDDTVGTFDNETVTVTYVGNNSTTESYEVTEIKGATHTVLANTVTGFTAPTGKSFSKWNTKADGTGTDKAAAATLTASADTTLYAIWA